LIHVLSYNILRIKNLMMN